MAGAGRLRFGRPAGPPLPLTQTVAFGSPTRKGYGGSPCRYTGVGTLSIVSQVNNIGASVSIFAIDGHNHLVYAWTGTTPAGSGAYGSAPPTVSAGPYTVEVTDGTYTSIITVPIDTYYYVAPHNTTPNADTNASNQLKLTAQLSGLAFGDHIILRDGEYNPTQTDWRIQRNTLTGSWTGVWTDPAGSGPTWNKGYWTDANWVVIRAENPLEAEVYQLGCDGFVSQNQYFSFRDIKFVGRNITGTSSGATGQFRMTNSAKIVDLQDCVFQGDRTLVNPGNNEQESGIVGAAGNDYLTVTRCTFDWLAVGMWPVGPHIAIDQCTFTNIFNQCINFTNSYLTSVTWCFMINKKLAVIPPPNDVHGDYIQYISTTMSAGDYGPRLTVGNIMARGEGTVDWEDGQGIFSNAGTTPAGVKFNNSYNRGNIYIGQFSRGISLGDEVDIDISFNTIVTDTGGNGVASPDPALISNENGTRGVIQYNAVTESCSDDDPVTPSTFTNNAVSIGDALADYQDYFAAPTLGEDNVSLAQIVAAWSMLVGGPLDKDVSGYPYNIGAAGTGYVDFANRTTNFPI